MNTSRQRGKGTKGEEQEKEEVWQQYSTSLRASRLGK